MNLILETTTIFVNCPSRGKSSNIVREQHTLDDYSERINDVLSQVIETYGIKNLVIIGYSMGGMIGTRLLKFNTLPISHLVYLNSAARITPNQSMLSRLFTSNSKRDHFKDEIIAFKNLPQYILKNLFITKIIAFVIYFHILHLLKRLLQISFILQTQITFQI